MKVKFTALLILALTVLFSVSCFAAPDTVSPNDYGTVSNLIVIKKPENNVSSTTKQNYTLSAVAVAGTEVALYSYNASTGSFQIKRDGSGNAMQTYVGATGLYIQTIDLSKNTNYLLVRAQSWDGNYQIVRLNITLLDQGLLNNIKGFATNFKSVFGGW
jgi:hypothetical protein